MQSIAKSWAAPPQATIVHGMHPVTSDPIAEIMHGALTAIDVKHIKHLEYPILEG